MNERKIGILISYINILLQTIVGFVYIPLLLHYIGKSEYGLFQLIGSFIAYFSIMDFGLTAAVVRFYTKYKVENDTVRMENILAISLRAYFVITIVLCAFGCICYFNLESIFIHSMTTDEIVSAKQLFLLLVFNIVLTISTMIFRAVINAYEKYLFLKGLETVQLVFQPLIILLVLQQYPYAIAVALVQTGLNMLLIIARIYYCFCKLKITIKFHYWDKGLFSDFKKLAFSVFAVTLIDQIFFKTNQVILGIVSGTSAVAVYSVSTLIYMNYMALSVAISGVYLPHITTIIVNNEPIKKLSDLFIQIGRWQYYLLALLASGFVIFGQRFIKIWAGNGFEDAYLITLLIIIPFTIDLIQNIGLAILQAQNKYDFRAKVYFVIGVFNLLLSIILVGEYGGIGCAFSTGIAMFIGNGLIMNWYYSKVTGLDIKEFWKQIGNISLGVVALTTMGYFVNNLIDNNNNIIIYSAKILFYTFIYMIVLYKCFMNNLEKEKVKKIFMFLRGVL